MGAFDFLANFFHPNTKIISPVPPSEKSPQFSNSIQSLNAAKALQQVRQQNPSANNLSDDEIGNFYQKYGNKIFSHPQQGQAQGASTGPTFQNGTAPVKAKDVILKATSHVSPDVDKFLQQTTFPVTDKAGIPRSIAGGMFGAEGRFKGLGADRNNFYNINARDSNPNAAFPYNTPEEGVKAYTDFITGQAPTNFYASPQHQQAFQKAYELRNDPAKMLDAIEKAGYAGDPSTYGQRAKNGFSSYSSFVQSTPEFQQYLTPTPTQAPTLNMP